MTKPTDQLAEQLRDIASIASKDISPRLVASVFLGVASRAMKQATDPATTAAFLRAEADYALDGTDRKRGVEHHLKHILRQLT